MLFGSVVVRVCQNMNPVICPSSRVQTLKIRSIKRGRCSAETYSFVPDSSVNVSVSVLQDILAYQRRSTHRLAPGLYLGFLKLSSSVDQIKVLVSQRTPNMLCHTRIRDNANVSRYVCSERASGKAPYRRNTFTIDLIKPGRFWFSVTAD